MIALRRKIKVQKQMYKASHPKRHKKKEEPESGDKTHKLAPITWRTQIFGAKLQSGSDELMVGESEKPKDGEEIEGVSSDDECTSALLAEAKAVAARKEKLMKAQGWMKGAVGKSIKAYKKKVKEESGSEWSSWCGVVVCRWR